MHNRPYTPTPRRMPIGLLATAVIVVVIFAAALVAIFYREWLIFSTNNPLVVELIRFIVFASVPSILVGGAVLALQIAWRRYGWRESIAAHYAVLMKRAETQAAPMATSYHQHIETTAVPALALPEPIEQIEVIKPMAEWMAWVDEQPHSLLGGKTKAGKTWLATALLERRIDAGCDIFIIDPHSSDWMGLPTAGGSGIPERKAAIKAVLSEYLRRMGIREEHKRETGRELPHDYFDPLVVLIDESNAMLEELAAEWRTVLKQVASGSRKVGIALLLLAQSPLVEDLGISGAMRENFSRIALDDRTVQALIDSERDKARKAALQAAFKTMDRPASAQIGPHVWLLDRRGLSPGNASSGARIWAGWDFENGCQASSVSPQHAPTEPLSDPHYFDNENNDTVISPGAGVAPVATVALSAPEIAQIATLLMTLPTSEVIKKLDGYNSRNYRELKTKVETVKNLIEGGKQ
jgi:hypothetical protein